MLAFLARRLGVMVLTALCLTLIVFALVNLKPNLVKLAKEQTGSRITEQQVEVWLDQNGFNRPFLGALRRVARRRRAGDLGHSTRFNAPVADVLWPRLWLTAKLMFWVMVVMVPGRAAARGARRHARGLGAGPGALDVAIGTTSTPEYVSGVVLTVIFASQMVGLQWFSGSATSAADDGITLYNFALPVLTIAIYGMGYIARMTRASMAEVMTQQYIRTARLKGVSFRGDRAEARAPQRADRAVHRDHAAVPLAPDRRRHRRDAVQLPRLRLAADRGRRRTTTSTCCSPARSSPSSSCSSPS